MTENIGLLTQEQYATQMRNRVQNSGIAQTPGLEQVINYVKNLKFDPKNEYSIPYMWGVMGIFYNQKYFYDSPHHS